MEEYPYTGRYGRRIYGSVTRGKHMTKFHLEFELLVGEIVFQTVMIPNDQLDRNPLIYKFVLDGMDQRIAKTLDEIGWHMVKAEKTPPKVK